MEELTTIGTIEAFAHSLRSVTALFFFYWSYRLYPFRRQWMVRLLFYATLYIACCYVKDGFLTLLTYLGCFDEMTWIGELLFNGLSLLMWAYLYRYALRVAEVMAGGPEVVPEKPVVERPSEAVPPVAEAVEVEPGGGENAAPRGVGRSDLNAVAA